MCGIPKEGSRHLRNLHLRPQHKAGNLKYITLGTKDQHEVVEVNSMCGVWLGKSVEIGDGTERTEQQGWWARDHDPQHMGGL